MKRRPFERKHAENYLRTEMRKTADQRRGLLPAFWSSTLAILIGARLTPRTISDLTFSSAMAGRKFGNRQNCPRSQML